MLEFVNKSNSYRLVLPRSKNILNCEQKQCILFSRAAKISELTNKSSSNQLHFVLPQRNTLEFTTKSKSTVFCSAPQKLLDCEQKHCILFSRAAKNFGLANKHCILFGRAAKNFGICLKRFLASVSHP
jgi:hypothetical protein